MTKALTPAPAVVGEPGASLHEDAVAVLTAWSAPDRTQSLLQERFLAHLAAQRGALSRECFPDHLTAGVLVVDEAGDQVLLNLHRKARRWFAFGGHCEPTDLTLAGAAQREGLEESGLATIEMDPIPVDLDLHAVEFCDPRGLVHHLDVRFTARASRTAQHATSQESLAVRWWPVDALPQELEAEMRLLISRSLERWR